MEQFFDVTIILLQGFWTNILIFALTLLISIPLGLVVTFGSMSKFKPLAYLSKILVWIVRGTPLMLQIFIIYYIPGFLGIPASSQLTSVIIAFAVNYAFYFSEIYRGGIEGVPKGQYEAGMVLGMTKPQIFKNIILLQVAKKIVPSMSNEVITLVKDTSLASVIGLTEIIKSSTQLMSSPGILYPLFYSGIFFLVFNGIVTLGLNKIEKKFSYYN